MRVEGSDFKGKPENYPGALDSSAADALRKTYERYTGNKNASLNEILDWGLKALAAVNKNNGYLAADESEAVHQSPRRRAGEDVDEEKVAALRALYARENGAQPSTDAELFTWLSSKISERIIPA